MRRSDIDGETSLHGDEDPGVEKESGSCVGGVDVPAPAPVTRDCDERLFTALGARAAVTTRDFEPQVIVHVWCVDVWMC